MTVSVAKVASGLMVQEYLLQKKRGKTGRSSGGNVPFLQQKTPRPYGRGVLKVGSIAQEVTVTGVTAASSSSPVRMR
ncbi:hypothetical protein RmaAA213_27100 [Rhodothermus marinus]|nr:hypothetical protein RmaAA213_27100 [Rhodothermus marinus]BBM73843.1 hypothetical protein RmaAA338_27080 [Rhodothermus marinus]